MAKKASSQLAFGSVGASYAVLSPAKKAVESFLVHNRTNAAIVVSLDNGSNDDKTLEVGEYWSANTRDFRRLDTHFAVKHDGTAPTSGQVEIVQFYSEFP